MNTYFDNSGTSFPKPPQVAEAISRYLKDGGGTYGRAAYGRAYEATVLVEECRDKLAELMGGSNSAQIAFTANSTTAINTIIKGLSLRGKRVLVSPLEHNAVMRPLLFLKETEGVAIEMLKTHSDGVIDIEALDLITRSNIGLVVINHQSNVSGVVQPVSDICKWAADIPVLIDGSQSVGHIPLHLEEWGVDYFAFTGHKGLLGPTGVGGFYAREPGNITPLIHGGTGSASDSFEMPAFVPDKYQAGTPNIVGIVGLLAALNNVPQPMTTSADLRKGIQSVASLKGFKVLCASSEHEQGGSFSFTHAELSPSQLARELYDKYGLEVRSGLHCAPAAHRFYSTFPQGSTRIALSAYHFPDDLVYLFGALKEIASRF
ncbi:aminotransferase class V-fold PLP-dependent enzyme [Geofilum rubicundum]|uniref:Cysteine desulfurase n=1 Tax=Geofilum rubicundum JCM 15548 TaxID=1236989 RepID=A0A0E9LYG3_9BACT|nr:aminotransferase class V-fold PLP-dependent enzyme [Geofilum rubicundum]GAO30299.1 cysteine desulfurase [Geofilum rubicundum JCM 15548]